MPPPPHAGGESSEPPANFQIFLASVQSADPVERRDAAMLLSNLGLPYAVRPLLRSYMTFGDRVVLDALARYGRLLTPVAAQEAREPSMGGERLARLLVAVGAAGDPAALPLARQHADHPSAEVHAAACGAMIQLGDPRGAERLSHDLEGTDPRVRLIALETLRALDDPAARAAVAAHVARYLGTAGAVPAAIEVFAPLLVEPAPEMARLLAERLRRSQDSLHLAIGPMAGRIAEEERGLVARATAGWRCFYSTPRHSTDEQLALLTEARDAARAPGAPAVLLLGPLPEPATPGGPAELLTWLPANPYTIRLLILGPIDYTAVMDWWHFAASAEVPVFMEVILDLVTLAADRMTDEERIVLHLVAPDDRGRFARALLGHL